MNAKKILFPTDFSTCSDAGLQQATALARDAGARLLIVHVEEPPIAYGGGEMYYGILEPDNAALLKMLRLMTATCAQAKVSRRDVLVQRRVCASLMQSSQALTSLEPVTTNCCAPSSKTPYFNTPPKNSTSAATRRTSLGIPS